MIKGSIFVAGKYSGLPEKSRPNVGPVCDRLTMNMFGLLRECGRGGKLMNLATLIATYGKEAVEQAIKDGHDLHLEVGKV